LLVVDTPIKANKDFDLVMFPNQRRGCGDATNYMTRRRGDYFVKHLLNMEPPKEYELKPPAPAGRGVSSPRQGNCGHARQTQNCRLIRSAHERNVRGTRRMVPLH